MHGPFLAALRRTSGACSGPREKKLRALRRDHSHPSLNFKKLKDGAGNRFSIRIGDHHRAIGRRMGEVIEWVWIGTHEDYNKLI